MALCGTFLGEDVTESLLDNCQVSNCSHYWDQRSPQDTLLIRQIKGLKYFMLCVINLEKTKVLLLKLQEKLNFSVIFKVSMLVCIELNRFCFLYMCVCMKSVDVALRKYEITLM